GPPPRHPAGRALHARLACALHGDERAGEGAGRAHPGRGADGLPQRLRPAGIDGHPDALRARARQLADAALWRACAAGGQRHRGAVLRLLRPHPAAARGADGARLHPAALRHHAGDPLPRREGWPPSLVGRRHRLLRRAGDRGGAGRARRRSRGAGDGSCDGRRAGDVLGTDHAAGPAALGDGELDHHHPLAVAADGRLRHPSAPLLLGDADAAGTRLAHPGGAGRRGGAMAADRGLGQRAGLGAGALFLFGAALVDALRLSRLRRPAGARDACGERVDRRGRLVHPPSGAGPPPRGATRGGAQEM
ncbi:MAG: putative membrane protein, partial [uncultured Craurococcus sp.]